MEKGVYQAEGIMCTEAQKQERTKSWEKYCDSVGLGFVKDAKLR